MKTVVTGAAGFIGQAVASRLNLTHAAGDIVLVDRVQPSVSFACTCVQADLTDRTQLARVIEGAQCVIHLAALPGGASEADPAGSRAINLDATLNLLELLERTGRPVRLVYASSVAVFGSPLPDRVDDSTQPRPSMTYGAHKLMVEIALADRVRRGGINGIALRLPGIVARPDSPTGFRSAFMSDIFREIRAGRPYEIPVLPTATMWLLSSVACADALIWGAGSEFPKAACPVVTLPALRVSMHDLVAAIGAATGSDTSRITYRADSLLTAQFGELPALATPMADALGFEHDGTLERLVARVLPSLDS